MMDSRSPPSRLRVEALQRVDVGMSQLESNSLTLFQTTDSLVSGHRYPAQVRRVWHQDSP
jgi:hypothetical protein